MNNYIVLILHVIVYFVECDLGSNFFLYLVWAVRDVLLLALLLFIIKICLCFHSFSLVFRRK